MRRRRRTVPGSSTPWSSVPLASIESVIRSHVRDASDFTVEVGNELGNVLDEDTLNETVSELSEQAESLQTLVQELAAYVDEWIRRKHVKVYVIFQAPHYYVAESTEPTHLFSVVNLYKSAKVWETKEEVEAFYATQPLLKAMHFAVTEMYDDGRS